VGSGIQRPVIMAKRNGNVSRCKKRYLDGDGISLAGFNEDKTSIAFRVLGIEAFNLEGCILQADRVRSVLRSRVGYPTRLLAS